jgi:hypothetical protein
MFIAISGIVFYSYLYLFRCAESVRILCGISRIGTGFLPLGAGYDGAPADSQNMAEKSGPPPRHVLRIAGFARSVNRYNLVFLFSPLFARGMTRRLFTSGSLRRGINGPQIMRILDARHLRTYCKRWYKWSADYADCGYASFVCGADLREMGARLDNGQSVIFGNPRNQRTYCKRWYKWSANYGLVQMVR